jgi:hypothetical protein
MMGRETGPFNGERMPQLALIIFGNWALGGGAIGGYYIPLHAYSWFVYSSSYHKRTFARKEQGFLEFGAAGFIYDY